MICVAVRDEHPGQRPVTECPRKGVQMGSRADAGVDERRLRAVEQPRVIAAPGEWTRVAGR